jgi:hypothetical protein
VHDNMVVVDRAAVAQRAARLISLCRVVHPSLLCACAQMGGCMQNAHLLDQRARWMR